MRFPSDPNDLAQITRAARQLHLDHRDGFFGAVRDFLARGGDEYRNPSPLELEAAIDHGLAAVAEGPAPIPLRFAEVDHSRRLEPDANARHLAVAFGAQLTRRGRR